MQGRAGDSNQLASKRHVAIIGAGITGSILACLLSKHKFRVTLIDKNTEPVWAASRWNEGKIHLGHLYSSDPGGASAQAMTRGALTFRSIIEQTIDESLARAITDSPDHYLVHRSSVVDHDSMSRYFDNLHDQLEQHDLSTYIGPYEKHSVLSTKEVDALSNGEATSGFTVHEYSVDTQWVADCVSYAVKQASGVVWNGSQTVTGIRSRSGGEDGPWTIHCNEQSLGQFDYVVNATWEGRAALDATVGLGEPAGWSHRYRLSVFVETENHYKLPNRVFAAGPFGDLKNYGGSRFYLSWYPTGLMATGTDLRPPPMNHVLPEVEIIEKMKYELTRRMPGLQRLFDGHHTSKLQGGWVFARGQGSLSDPRASIHRRDQFGIRRRGTYFSVDTGKYSTGPWLAQQITNAISSA